MTSAANALLWTFDDIQAEKKNNQEKEDVSGKIQA
jgi:hypothetical protein